LALHVCARGDGIRGSKDLRAEIGKFPNSTNERKQMSNKTLNKRIALVAVTALTAGLFSVVAPSAANAGYGSNVAAATGTNPAIAVADTLYIASAPATAKAVVIGASTTAIADSPATSAAKSLGILNVSDLAGGVTAGTTSTATMLSSGTLSVYVQSASGKYSSIVVTGGTISESSGDTLAADSTSATAGNQSTAANWGALIRPSSGVTQMTVRYYGGYAYATSDTASNTAVAANPTGATGLSLQGQITVTVTSASTVGAMSSAYSAVYGASGASDQSNIADDASYLGSAAFNTAMYLNIRVRDAFANGLTSTSGLLQVSATNGALVNLEASSASSAGTTTSDYATGAAPDNYMVRVDAPSNAPVLTTVTATYNGTVIGSKTMLFTGKVTKVELYGAAIGSTTANTTTNYAYYKLTDAAGNSTYTTVAGSAISAYPYSTLSANSAAITGAATTVTKSREFSLGTNYSTVTSGRVYFSCTSTAGKGKIGLTYANLDGSIVNSNVLDVTCAGDPVTYKASWDKTSYTPGDLATLTITAYDSKGNVANDVGTVTDSTDATKIPVVAIGGLDKTITGPTTGDALDQGVIKYKYTVGATEGSYSGKVSFPTIDARYASNVSAAGSDPVTVTLTVKNSTASVSNADVLKSIVALIASINKQIQALQKLILKR